MTETAPQRPRELLGRVRGHGYAVNRGSYRDEAGGAAAPIPDQTGRADEGDVP
jgi:DNA-binding IclR family transcriptional regulator